MASPSGQTLPLERRAGSLLALSFPALAVADKGTAVLAIVVLWALLTLPRHGRALRDAWHDYRLIAFAFAGFFLWASLSLLASGSGPRDVGLTLRLPVLLLALPLLAALRIEQRFVWWGLWLGAMTAFWLAAWDRYVNGAIRAGDSFHFVIHFGDLAVLFSCLLAFGWCYWRSLRWGPALMGAAVLGGLLAAVWSGTRGAWLAVPVLAAYVFLSPALDLPRRTRLAVLALFAAACALATLVPASGVRDGVARVFDDARAYANGEDIANSSGGTRLELWRRSWGHFVEHPLAGVGAYRLQQANQAAARSGAPIPPSTLEFGHAHSQVFEVLATGGLVGSVALVALFVLPWRFFRAACRDRDHASRRACGLAGRATLIGFAVFGLTQSVFNHQGPLGVFAFLVLYFAVLSRAPAAAPAPLPAD